MPNAGQNMENVIMCKGLIRISIGLLMVICVGCAGGYVTKNVNGNKSVYRTGEDGQRHLVYTVSRDGKTTVSDKEDPMYKQHAQQVAYEEERQKQEADRKAAVMSAQKRGPNDPIYVFFSQTSVGPKLAKVEHKPGAIHAEIKKHMGNDPIVSWVENRSKADIILTTDAVIKEEAGYNKKTKKIGTYPALTLTTKWQNVYTGETGETTDKDHILQNQVLTKRFAANLETIIKRDIGSSIPADRTQYRPGTSSRGGPSISLEELKGKFKY